MWDKKLALPFFLLYSCCYIASCEIPKQTPYALGLMSWYKDRMRNQAFEHLTKLFVIMLVDYIGCRILLLCSDSNRCTMTITAGYIKYTFSFCSEITGQNITRKEGSYVPDVERTIRVWPCSTYNNVFHNS